MRFNSSLITSPSCSTCGRSVCRRENASSWRTRPAARLAFCLICMMSWKDGSVGRWLAEQQVGIADDGGQHVVEIVGDAAGELADRLHLLRLGEILLQRLLLGRVERVDRGAAAVLPRPEAETKRRAECGRRCRSWSRRPARCRSSSPPRLRMARSQSRRGPLRRWRRRSSVRRPVARSTVRGPRASCGRKPRSTA